MKTPTGRVLFLLALFAGSPSAARAERVRARVLDADARHSEVRLDVAGRRRRYRIEDRSLYLVLRRDRMVVVRSELIRGRHTIVDAKPATLEGRVERVDRRGRTVVIRDSGSGIARTYGFAKRVPRGLQEGQSITYDVAERRSREVITRWHTR